MARVMEVAPRAWAVWVVEEATAPVGPKMRMLGAIVVVVAGVDGWCVVDVYSGRWVFGG
jgi:hypothetical protein